MLWPLIWTTLALVLITIIMACLMFKRQRRIDDDANKSVLQTRLGRKKRSTIVSANDSDKSDGESSDEISSEQ